MKEIFQNVVGFNTAEIVINCAAGELSLDYQLSDNPVQHAWQQIHSDSKHFNVSLPVNSPKDKILSIANSICSEVGMKLIPEDFTEGDLNQAHGNMVNLIDANDHMDLLNKCIHILEAQLKNKYIQYNSNITFFKDDNSTFIPIKEEYKMWLESSPKWGDLVLGYGTLGKDWLDIFNDNDNKEELAIQTQISSETCMVFRTEYNFPKAVETLFYRWAKKTNIAPIESLNALSLGRYFLGRIIINDTMLDYHSNVGDWYIPNHICKLNWNKDIIGSNVSIKKITFYNDNKYQDMSIDHAKIKPIL